MDVMPAKAGIHDLTYFSFVEYKKRSKLVDARLRGHD